MASVAFVRQFDNKNNWPKRRTKREQGARRERREESKCQPPKTIFQANIYKSAQEMGVGQQRRATLRNEEAEAVGDDD